MSRMAIQGMPCSMPNAKIGMMFGCSSFAMTLASRSNRAANVGSWRNSGGSTLRATNRSSAAS